MSHDPRTTPVLLPRDAEALAFIGRGYEVAQYQLRAAIFSGLSEVVCSRRVRRWVTEGHLVVDRFQGFGINRLRLTDVGKEAVVASGAAKAGELFVPRKAVALKDLAHTLWINDLRVLAHEGIPFSVDSASPAWLLQRRFTPAPPALPDLLLVRKGRDGKKGRMLAVEVDLGAERLAATFLPKLRLLVDVLSAWAGSDVRPAILVLTRGPKRLESLRAGITKATLPIPIASELLPSATGGEGLDCLRAVISGGASSNPQASKQATASEAVHPVTVG